MELTATSTDQYQLTMGQAYYRKGKGEKQAVFDYFFRKLPFNSGYAIFSGLEVLLETLENLYFSEEDIAYLSKLGFDKEYIEFLKRFKFRGNIYSAREGDLVFPTRPVLTVEANMIEAQIIETLLLNILNYQTLIATKASRMRKVAGDRILLDFGMRRAHGPAAHYASRAAYAGGFNGTSNVRAGRDFGIPVSGTMAHSYVQSFDKEIDAFRSFADVRPEDCVLLADTYNTLGSGIPNAIKVAKEMEEKGYRLNGIRLDSGDLAYLSNKARKMLDDAGLNYVKIAASNQLDEYLIKSLLDQGAPIDVFGVGTSLVTGKPEAALDGVYKLAYANEKPRIKVSENTSKVTLPFKKQVYRVFDSNGELTGSDIVTLWDEKGVNAMYHPFDPLQSVSFNNCSFEAQLNKVMEKGKRTKQPVSINKTASYTREKLMELPEEYKRFENPHIYKVGLSHALKKERDVLLKRYMN